MNTHPAHLLLRLAGRIEDAATALRVRGSHRPHRRALRLGATLLQNGVERARPDPHPSSIRGI